ncbi:CbrC family protein [Actinophytocola sp. KF-1]
MTLPVFTYHPDPLATGSVVVSGAECASCGQVRGHVYTGPVYAEDEVEHLCPWCIADGSAAARLGAEFTEVDGDVPDDVLVTITQRTPGFSGWQQERWLAHCGDGAEYLGRAGAAGLAAHPDLESDFPLDDARFLAALDEDGPPTAYLFRCRRCGTHLAYADST